MMPSRFIPVVADDRIFFIGRLNNIPFCYQIYKTDFTYNHNEFEHRRVCNYLYLLARVQRTIICLDLGSIATTEIFKNLSLSGWSSAKQLFSKVILRASLGGKSFRSKRRPPTPGSHPLHTHNLSLLFPVEQPQKTFSKSIQKTLVSE